MLRYGGPQSLAIDRIVLEVTGGKTIAPIVGSNREWEQAMHFVKAAAAGQAVDFSEVISSLSYALDITEGQPAGHAARSCILGMRIARELGLDVADRSALFYALLLKDLGCSSNASKVCYLFGTDDRKTKCDLKTTDWTRLSESMRYVARNVVQDGTMLQKASRFVAVAARGQKAAKELVQIRCDRGAAIARSLLLPEATAVAIHSLDEHWDGSGYPDCLHGDAIPLFGRILGLAQTAEVFWHRGGVEAACEVARKRSGTWFDPQLVEVLLSLEGDAALAADMGCDDAAGIAAKLEPAELVIHADEDALDRVSEGFSHVIDAKSPWTFCHSSGVAEVATGIGSVLGIEGRRLQKLRRAALLHDIGKLGVSNQILDKPGKLNAEELAAMRKHPDFTLKILSRVRAFRDFAEAAASHHERLDGRGYHRGMSGAALSLEVRILAVADMYEALAAKRPYRQDLSKEEVMTILKREAGVGLCPSVVAALQSFLAHSNFVPYQVAA
jgi:putative nucleotidyltransferase with HDIG domain